jgi:hypothetical protein
LGNSGSGLSNEGYVGTDPAMRRVTSLRSCLDLYPSPRRGVYFYPIILIFLYKCWAIHCHDSAVSDNLSEQAKRKRKTSSFILCPCFFVHIFVCILHDTQIDYLHSLNTHTFPYIENTWCGNTELTHQLT